MKNITRILWTFSALLLAIAILYTDFSSEIDAPYTTNYSEWSIDGCTMHHLSNDAICGITDLKGDYINYEAFAGLKVHCSGSVVSYTMYTHSDSYQEGAVSIQRGDLKSPTINLGIIKNRDTKSFGIKDIVAQMPDIPDQIGIYKITIISGKDHDESASIYLYYDGNRVQACKIWRYGQNSMERWANLVKNLDPTSCLDMYVGNPSVPITYPTSGTNGSCNHVKEWCDLSDDIVKHDDWTDEAKVFAMVLYLTRNYAYDNYRVYTCNNVSRAMKDNAWTDDGHFMFYNNVGTCFDCCNALCIMCRHQGIPCTSVENDYHTVNAVWLDGEWVAIDVSALLLHHCDTENTSRDNWEKSYHSSYSQYYGYYDGSMETYNQALATPETMLSGRSGKNPI